VSRRGRVKSVELRVTETVAPGQLFTPFHYFEANANQVTQSAFDPISREPNYKQSAVRIEPGTRDPGLGIRGSGFAAAAKNQLSIARFWRGSTIPILPRQEKASVESRTPNPESRERGAR
jgi:predicted molibdopterin-dependent oxidoreductase YjgC